MAIPVDAGLPLSAKKGVSLSTHFVVRTLWQERFIIGLTTVFFTGIGLLMAFLLAPEFRSEARIMPEMANGSGNILKRLASVAGFAGIDLPDAEDMDAVRPDLYPNVLQSTPFILHLINQPVTTTDGQTKTVGQFLIPDTTRWSVKRLLAFGKLTETKPSPILSKGTVRLSMRQQELADEIEERVSARFDTRSGIITLRATMPDANVSATVTQLSMDYLMQYVTSYRTEKARQDLQFYSRQLAEAHKRFQAAQFNVFQYNDRHKNIVLLATTMDRQRMETELTISQTVYTELAQQFEQARLKVQARTPIFKVLEPPKVPLKRASPKRILLVMLFAGAGFLLSAMFVISREANLIGQLRSMVRADSE